MNAPTERRQIEHPERDQPTIKQGSKEANHSSPPRRPRKTSPSLPGITQKRYASDYPVNNIHDEFLDKCGKRVVLRTGYYDTEKDRGFGQDKAEYKHNIVATSQLLKQVTSGTCSRYQNENTRVYEYTVWPKDCTSSRPGRLLCDRGQPPVTVIVVHSDRLIEDGKPKGVITMYCDGYRPKCPGWVDAPDQVRTVNGVSWGRGGDNGTVTA